MFKHKEYIHTGTCIWCKRNKSFTTFNNAPHIIPHSLGSDEIGFDVCDDCNRYFGTCTQGNILCSNIAFKEVFNICLNSLGKRSERATKISSMLFHYNPQKDRIKLKRNISIAQFTKTFKRSLYEVFLQKYHATFPDEHLERFEAVRKFARYGIGDLAVIYATNKIILHFEDKAHDISLSMSETDLEFMNKTGFFHFFFCGQHLFLEVLPITVRSDFRSSLIEMYKMAVIPVDSDCKLNLLDDITRFDMFYTALTAKIIDYNGKRFY